MSTIQYIGPINTGLSIEVVQTTKYVQSDCNAMMFWNQGQSVVVIDNQLQIGPGQHWSIPGEIYEILRKQWQIAFTGTGLNNLLIIRKTYQGVN